MPARRFSSFRALALISASSVIAACGGEDHSQPPTPEESTFVIAGKEYYQIGFDPQKGTALQLLTNISGSGRTSFVNLMRWQINGENRNLGAAVTGFQQKFDHRMNSSGYVYYKQRSAILGAASQSGSHFTMMGPNPIALSSASVSKGRPGWVMSAQLAPESSPLTNADIAGNYVCGRLIRNIDALKALGDNSPDYQTQLITMDVSDSGGITYQVDGTSEPGSAGTMAVGAYELSDRGMLTMTSDSFFPLDGVSLDPDDREVRAWKGAFDKSSGLFFVAYMIGYKEPTKSELLNDYVERQDDENQAFAFMACMKDGASDPMGSNYWYEGNRVANSVENTAVFGGFKVTGNQMQWNECESSTTLRQMEVSFSQDSDGRLDLDTGVQQFKGILSQDLNFMLLVSYENPNEQGMTFAYRKFNALTCPVAK